MSASRDSPASSAVCCAAEPRTPGEGAALLAVGEDAPLADCSARGDSGEIGWGEFLRRGAEASTGGPSSSEPKVPVPMAWDEGSVAKAALMSCVRACSDGNWPCRRSGWVCREESLCGVVGAFGWRAGMGGSVSGRGGFCRFLLPRLAAGSFASSFVGGLKGLSSVYVCVSDTAQHQGDIALLALNESVAKGLLQ